MKLNNIQDIFNLVGEVPFIWKCQNQSNTEYINQLILNTNEASILMITFNEQGEFQYIDSSSSKLDSKIGIEIQLVDWFEKEINTNSHNCSCDFIKVLQQGCKCGAIEPYERKLG